jgi:hypothetical protein
LCHNIATGAAFWLCQLLHGRILLLLLLLRLLLRLLLLLLLLLLDNAGYSRQLTLLLLDSNVRSRWHRLWQQLLFLLP